MNTKRTRRLATIEDLIPNAVVYQLKGKTPYTIISVGSSEYGTYAMVTNGKRVAKLYIQGLTVDA